MIKPKPEFEEENIKLYELWKENGMKMEDIDSIIEKYGSSEYKAWCKAVRAEKERELCGTSQAQAKYPTPTR